jgi:hypothetical protein
VGPPTFRPVHNHALPPRRTAAASRHCSGPWPRPGPRLPDLDTVAAPASEAFVDFAIDPARVFAAFSAGKSSVALVQSCANSAIVCVGVDDAAPLSRLAGVGAGVAACDGAVVGAVFAFAPAGHSAGRFCFEPGVSSY